MNTITLPKEYWMEKGEELYFVYRSSDGSLDKYKNDYVGSIQHIILPFSTERTYKGEIFETWTTYDWGAEFRGTFPEVLNELMKRFEVMCMENYRIEYGGFYYPEFTSTLEEAMELVDAHYNSYKKKATITKGGKPV